MPAARTALEHLHDARSALAQEAERLNAAIAELDSVIAGIGGSGGIASALAGEADPSARQPVARPVNSAVDVETASGANRGASARKAATKGAARRRAPARSAGDEAPKSIRVHVLDMLAAEDRDFGLAEIIDRVHGAGIPAHDDAVRSITTKLMKDGRVERVGRGQYRLARRANRAAAPGGGAGSEPAGNDAGHPAEPATNAADVAGPAAGQATSTGSSAAGYSPPLNLNQPWGATRR